MWSLSSSISEGPQYTFWNSQTQTSVDYTIGCLQASQFIHHCFTHELSLLNTSVHLPISTVLHIPVVNSKHHHYQKGKKIDWVKACNTGRVGAYQELVSPVVYPLLGRMYMYDTPEHLDREIISNLSRQPAAPYPLWYHLRSRRSGSKIRNSLILQHARKLPGTNGHPVDVHKKALHEERIRSRTEFRKRLNICSTNTERARVQKIDHKLKQRSSNRFKISKPTNPGSVRVNGSIT